LLMGEIAAQDDGADATLAADHYRYALAQATELGMRPLVAHCQLALAQWHRRAGDQARAREQMDAARTLYREMGVTLWLARVEAEEPVTA